MHWAERQKTKYRRELKLHSCLEKNDLIMVFDVILRVWCPICNSVLSY